MRIAQIQSLVSGRKEENLDRMEEEFCRLDGQGIDLVMFGEMFCCPYETPAFPLYAEKEGGRTWQRLSSMARDHRVILSAGTMPETDEGGHVYNTAFVFDREGRQIARYRKRHLFEVDIPADPAAGRPCQSFHESETLTAGKETVTFDTEFGRLGICICFDMRFPDQFRDMALAGARLLLVPAAFNLSTGPVHWDLLHRSNALSSQCFIAATSTARNEHASYVSYGHSMLVSPWGNVISELDEAPGTLITDIDLAEADRIRQQLPVLSAIKTEAAGLPRRTIS